MPPLPSSVDGECHPRFRAVADLLSRQIETGLHHGVALAVRQAGTPVVDIWGGRRIRDGVAATWQEDTMAVSFSTTKGVAATALHMAMSRRGVDYDTPVAHVWPEFAGNGKDRITIRHCLCHEAGVPQIKGEVPDVSAMSDWRAMTAMMERLTPLWEPGTANGYHAVNFGWLVGELVERIDGRPFPQFLDEEIASPLALDGLFVGTPPPEHARVAELLGGELQPAAAEALLPPGHLLPRVLGPDGDMRAFLNSKEGLETVAPAFSGCFTARSLATLYAALERGGSLDGVELLDPATLATAVSVQNKRPDLVLIVPMYWRLGFMGGGSMLSPVGPHREAFGHSGFGGSVAFADPRAGISMAVVLDQLEVELLAGERVRALVRAVIEAAVG